MFWIATQLWLDSSGSPRASSFNICLRQHLLQRRPLANVHVGDVNAAVGLARLVLDTQQRVLADVDAARLLATGSTQPRLAVDARHHGVVGNRRH